MFDLSLSSLGNTIYPEVLMKRFIVSILSVTVFCIGLGALVEEVGAGFKSDEKAIALIKQARIAIGGEQSIAEVRSMIIKGNATHTIKMGTETRTEQGETEIAMQLPDKLSKMVKIGRHDGPEGEKVMGEKHDVMIVRSDAKQGEWATSDGKKVIVKRTEGVGPHVEKIIIEGKNGESTTPDGKKVIVRTIGGGEGKNGEFTTDDGKKIIVRSDDGHEVEKVIVRGDKAQHMKLAGGAGAAHSGMRQNELLRTTLSLLLTAPEGMDVSYTFVGEGDVEGTSCNIVNAGFGGSNIKLYLSKASSLPVMVSYQGHALPRVMQFRTKAPEGTDVSKDVVMFNHKIDGGEMAEFNVRFSDYRSVNGVQLPYRWTTAVAGQTSEVFDVTGYQINPANIADRFQNQKVMVRTQNKDR